MKKIFFSFLVVAIAKSAFAQNCLDVRFDSKSVPQAVTFIHNGQNYVQWQGFFKIFPNNMLWEIGPTLNFGPIGITIRTGVHFKTLNGELKYDHQEATVLSGKWRSFKFISINEFSPFKGIEYFYEHELSYQFIGCHIEALFIDKKFEPFIGPIIYPKFKKVPGDVYFTLLWRLNGHGEYARIGYKIIF